MCRPQKIDPEIYTAIFQRSPFVGLQSGRRISVSMDFTFNLNAEWLEHGPGKGEAMGNELLCVLPLKGSNA